MQAPGDCRYSDSHEWYRIEGDTLTLGITQHAVDQLTDVTFVDMKPSGTTIEAGDPVGEVESVKTTSDIYCAASGEIIEVNGALESNPGLINADPYGDGWLVKVRIGDASGLESLMSADDYLAKHGG